MIAKSDVRLSMPGVILSMLLTCCGACREVTGPQQRIPVRPDVREWVTAELAARLDLSGNFLFEALPPKRGTVPATANQFMAVAGTFVRGLLSGAASGTAPRSEFDILSIRSGIELIHRSPIDWDNVFLATWPPFGAQTPVSTVSTEIPASLSRAVGSRYHVLLYDGYSAIADIAVSADLAGVQLSPDSTAFERPMPSELVRTEGIPVSLGDSLPLIPEVAVRDVASRTGAKVDRVPRFVLPWDHFGPVYSKWILHLDRSVTLTRDDDGSSVVADEVLVGLGPGPGGVSVMAWYVPTATQPLADTWPYRRRADGGVDSVTFQFGPDAVVRVVRVRR